jgi:hypothetical protein
MKVCIDPSPERFAVPGIAERHAGLAGSCYLCCVDRAPDLAGLANDCDSA